MVTGKPKVFPQHVICIQSRIHDFWKKTRLDLPQYGLLDLNSRWLPGTIKKPIPDTLGKSVLLSAIASGPGTCVFLCQMGEANKTAGSRTVGWGHRGACPQIELPWLCRGHCCLGPQWGSSPGCGKGGGDGRMGSAWPERLVKLWVCRRVRILGQLIFFKICDCSMCCERSQYHSGISCPSPVLLTWERDVKLPKGWMSCWSTWEIPHTDVGLGPVNAS